jgi:crossover junction endodeoxyribonuclease RuvC
MWGNDYLRVLSLWSGVALSRPSPGWTFRQYLLPDHYAEARSKTSFGHARGCAEVRIVGIDPGLSGALVVLDESVLEFYDTPTLQVKSGKSMKRVINIHEAASLLFAVWPELVIIEKVNAMPPGEGQRMGATSAFNFGMGYGIWLGILAAFEFPYKQVTPQAWKKLLMEGMSKEKDASRVRAMELYPQVASYLKLAKHHGRADALLLAHYGKVTK